MLFVYLFVHLVAPRAGKDVVELDVDDGEGQEARHAHFITFPIITFPKRGLILPSLFN